MLVVMGWPAKMRVDAERSCKRIADERVPRFVKYRFHHRADNRVADVRILELSDLTGRRRREYRRDQTSSLVDRFAFPQAARHLPVIALNAGAHLEDVA